MTGNCKNVLKINSFYNTPWTAYYLFDLIPEYSRMITILMRFQKSNNLLSWASCTKRYSNLKLDIFLGHLVCVENGRKKRCSISSKHSFRSLFMAIRVKMLKNRLFLADHLFLQHSLYLPLRRYKKLLHVSCF